MHSRPRYGIYLIIIYNLVSSSSHVSDITVGQWYDIGGSYFGTKKACENVHIQYSYTLGDIWVVNSLYVPTSTMIADITAFTPSSSVLYQARVSVPSIASDGAISIASLPIAANFTRSYFLRLILSSNDGSKVISRNVYWLSTVKDVLDWKNSTFYQTPCTSFADLSLLQGKRSCNCFVIPFHDT
jgi:exo-1,4-beta-D-glucosaminidase